MHRYWDIPELVQDLIAVADRQSQGRMTQVNSRVGAIAAQQLWEMLPAIEILTKLNFTSEDLTRFDVYSPFVKGTANMIDQSALKVLLQIRAYRKTPFLLPNLIDARLRVYVSLKDNMTTMLPPTLQTLALDLEDGWNDPVVPDVKFPSLTSFRLLSHYIAYTAPWKPDPFDAITRFLQTHQDSLTDVALAVPVERSNVDSILDTLASMPYLQSLHLMRNWIDSGGRPSPTGYAVLKSLRLQLGQVPGQVSFLSSVSLAALETLVLELQADTLQPAVLLISPFQSLKDIDLDVRSGDVASDTLDPLLHCRGLTSFQLTLQDYCRLDGGDATLSRLTRAWPHLRVLRLKIRDGYGFTLRGTQCLAEHCPDLETLQIMVDMHTINDALVTQSAHKLKNLHLGWSFVADQKIATVAKFIGQMWPNREISETYWTGAEADDTMWKSWTEVWFLADRISKERGDTRPRLVE